MSLSVQLPPRLRSLPGVTLCFPEPLSRQTLPLPGSGGTLLPPPPPRDRDLCSGQPHGGEVPAPTPLTDHRAGLAPAPPVLPSQKLSAPKGAGGLLPTADRPGRPPLFPLSPREARRGGPPPPPPAPRRGLSRRPSAGTGPARGGERGGGNPRPEPAANGAEDRRPAGPERRRRPRPERDDDDDGGGGGGGGSSRLSSLPSVPRPGTAPSPSPSPHSNRRCASLHLAPRRPPHAVTTRKRRLRFPRTFLLPSPLLPKKRPSGRESEPDRTGPGLGGGPRSAAAGPHVRECAVGRRRRRPLGGAVLPPSAAGRGGRRWRGGRAVQPASESFPNRPAPRIVG